MKFEDTSKYKDIIDIKNFEPNHPRMENYKRAAQFAPFAALTGYEEAIEETGRQVASRPVLCEDMEEIISRRLTKINSLPREQYQVKVTYFKEDDFKIGGHILEKEGIVKGVREYERDLFFEDGAVIPIKDLLDITEITKANET